MKNIPIKFLEHKQSSTTTICTLWRCERTDGKVFCFTDVDIDVTLENEIYMAGTGITPSAVTNQSSLAVDNLTVTGVLNSDTITDDDLLAGAWNNAQITVMQGNYNAIDDGVEIIRFGYLGDITKGRTQFEAELRGLAQKAQSKVGNVTTVSCSAKLGDNRCKINLALFTKSGTVTTAGFRDRLTDTSRTEDKNYFQYGVLTFTSGNNNGYSVEVKSNDSGLIIFQLPMPKNISVGDTYNVYAGCNKSLEHCRDKFNNVNNHRGFPHVTKEALEIGNN